MTRPTLNDLNAFISVATHRSFRRAADVLGVSRSALSHAMRDLEDTLGTRLLHRTTRSVTLTEDGERLLKRLVPVLQDLDSALGDTSAAAGQLSGTLRINGPEAAIRWLLQHVIPRYMALHPGVELDLSAEGQLVDIVAQGFDAGIRLGEAVSKEMVAITLTAQARFLAVATPDYLAQYGHPQTPDELHQHHCIRQRLPSGKRYRWEFARAGKEIMIDVTGTLTLDNSQLMVEAATDSLGIAYVPEHYARTLLDAGTLVAVLEDWCPAISGLHLYFPRTRHMTPALRALIDLIRQEREQ